MPQLKINVPWWMTNGSTGEARITLIIEMPRVSPTVFLTFRGVARNDLDRDGPEVIYGMILPRSCRPPRIDKMALSALPVMCVMDKLLKELNDD